MKLLCYLIVIILYDVTIYFKMNKNDKTWKQKKLEFLEQFSFDLQFEAYPKTPLSATFQVQHGGIVSRGNITTDKSENEA